MDLIKEIKKIKEQLSKLEKFAEEKKSKTVDNFRHRLKQFVYGGKIIQN